MRGISDYTDAPVSIIIKNSEALSLYFVCPLMDNSTGGRECLPLTRFRQFFDTHTSDFFSVPYRTLTIS